MIQNVNVIDINKRHNKSFLSDFRISLKTGYKKNIFYAYKSLMADKM